MRLRGSVLGKPPASGYRLPVYTFCWFTGAVPTGRLRGCPYLTVSPLPPPIVVGDVVQTVFSQAKDP